MKRECKMQSAKCEVQSDLMDYLRNLRNLRTRKEQS